MGGFECSAQKTPDGRRLDLLNSSGHATHALADYRLLAECGMRSVRDGIRWHLVETMPGRYDWSSFLPMLRASRDAGVQVVWDLCHYGWPDHVDIWSAAFVDRFAAFAAATARLIREETGAAPFVCPINEMSYLAWAGAEVGRINPCETGRGGELKRQLARAVIAAVNAIRDADPEARFLYAEPAIHVDGGTGPGEHQRAAEAYRLAQFEALDLISGRLAPELGGTSDNIDIVGANYYPDNQWYLGGSTIPLGHHAYRPFSEILLEIAQRYRRPMIVAETGAEGSARAAWLHYVFSEVSEAMRQGAPIEALCLYPIVDVPGWENGRICPVGLFSMPDAEGRRMVYEPLARELRAYQQSATFAPMAD